MAVVTDEAPGKGVISKLFLIHSFIKVEPGSDTVGVPASHTNEIVEPVLNNSKILETFFFLVKFMI